MRLVSYGAKWEERAGILTDGGIVDLEGALQAARAGKPTSDMRLFLEQEGWRSLLDKAYAQRSSAKTVDAKSVRLGAPVPFRGSRHRGREHAIAHRGGRPCAEGRRAAERADAPRQGHLQPLRPAR